MTPGVQALLSGSLTFGVPMLCAVRELILLRRSRDDPGHRPDRDPPPPDDQPPPQLPACLRFERGKVPPIRTRELV